MKHEEIKQAAHGSPVVQLKDAADERLVELVQNGSEAAFAELMKRYMQKSCAIAFQIVGDSETAKDLSQDVFVKIYRSIHQFKKGNRFFSWFYRILLNHCINYHRRKKNISIYPFSHFSTHSEKTLDVSDASQQSSDEKEDRRKIVSKAVNRLSAKHKKVVILCDIESLSQEEAAEILGISVGTVRSRLHYARKHLKRFLKDYITEL